MAIWRSIGIIRACPIYSADHSFDMHVSVYTVSGVFLKLNFSIEHFAIFNFVFKSCFLIGRLLSCSLAIHRKITGVYPLFGSEAFRSLTDSKEATISFVLR